MPRRIIERLHAEAAQASAGGMTIVRGGEMPDGPRTAAPSRPVFVMPREGPLGGRILSALVTPNGVFGASVSTVNGVLARVLNLKAGVLVNDVPEDSPAFRAGLRTGDVITGVGDQPIISLYELRQRVLSLSRERAIPLQVTSHNQKTRTVTVSMTSPSTPSP
jgi:membrane-associated protease RseP (regulator of RpoE activity)